MVTQERASLAAAALAAGIALTACGSGGVCPGDAGMQGWRWIEAQTPLPRCGSADAGPPQSGLCDAGLFPDYDISCGPASCACTERGTRACLRPCRCDGECAASERCDVHQVFWGSDAPSYNRGLCRPR